MKKTLSLLSIVLCLSATATAQNTKTRSIFNHLGVHVSAGTEGIGVGAASPVTNFLEVGFGVNIMPEFMIKGDVGVNDLVVSGVKIPMSDVELKGNFARTTCDLKVNCYPFGGKSKFFVAAGLSFAGNKLVKLEGHSDDVKKAIIDHPELKDKVMAEIDQYNVKFDNNGDVFGDIRKSGFRPYLGFGFGRLVPKKRISTRLELGCQFHGKLKIYQNKQEVAISDLKKEDDTFSKIIDKFKVYPVLKFSLTGRIF